MNNNLIPLNGFASSLTVSEGVSLASCCKSLFSFSKYSEGNASFFSLSKDGLGEFSRLLRSLELDIKMTDIIRK